MKYDWLLIALYLLVLAVIVREFFGQLALAGIVVLLMVIVIVQKIGLENLINSKEKERDRKLGDIITRVDNIAARVDSHREDFSRQIVFVDNKVSDVRHFVEVEVNNAYTELSRKLMAIEEKINEVRQVFSAAVGSLDDRVHGVEKEEEEIF